MAPDPRRVFMLEDDPAVVDLVTAAMAKAGLEVRAAGSLQALESLTAAQAPDLFILDVNLPDGSGFEACRLLRERPLTARVPIIFLTRRDEVENRLRAFQLGAQDYVIKPFSPEELVARVRAHLMLKAHRDQDEARLAELALHERVQTDLMDMVIHDIRTPIATVRLTLDMLAEEGAIGEPQHVKLVEMAGRATDAALLMLNDLMDLRAGRVHTELAPFPLSRPLRRAAQILGPAAGKKRISVEAASSPEEGRAVSDEKMLLRVALNLLGNAIKYSPGPSAVAMSLRHAGGRLRLEVSDRGPGVPEADRERIFEKFQRAGEAALAAPGTGIGLAFCRLAAASLGGRTWCEERPGGGSLFVFEVPAGEDPGLGEAAALLGPEVMKEYADDCASRLAELESALPSAAQAGPEFLESVRLTAHRLSGSAGTYGYEEASRIAGRLERRVLESRSGGMPPGPAEIRLALRELRRALSLPE